VKSIVIYFSQTGNTKTIAQAIQKGIIKQTGQCDIKRLKEIKPEELVNYDPIGSPVWSSCPTPNVIEFEQSLPLNLKGKHFFFFCTHGVLPGRCIIRGVKPLQERGMTVIGWKDWYCGACVIGHAKPWFTDGHPDAIDLGEAESFGLAMVEHSRKISQGAIDIIPVLPSPEASDQIYGIGHPFIFPLMMSEIKNEDSSEISTPVEHCDKSEKKQEGRKLLTSMSYVMELEGMPVKERRPPGGELRINPEKCTGCGLCAEACFCNNIVASIFPPVFKSQDCERDLFCEGVCPTGAIEFEFPSSDVNTGNMWHIMKRILDLAEATGRFRRLIREEDIGWSTPWEVATGHPRHKIIP